MPSFQQTTVGTVNDAARPVFANAAAKPAFRRVATQAELADAFQSKRLAVRVGHIQCRPKQGITGGIGHHAALPSGRWVIGFQGTATMAARAIAGTLQVVQQTRLRAARREVDDTFTRPDGKRVARKQSQASHPIRGSSRFSQPKHASPHPQIRQLA
ncbi:MAG: hypothetical protein BWZ07_01226 [Alphaproteobacteria bacterium ADurb.BinA280]|nr:MAG: hypothetical protein BWZ07_01226 [Alphaproteobacteria bacterium ADurb.BinA280]